MTDTYVEVLHEPGVWVRARVEKQWRYEGRWRLSVYYFVDGWLQHDRGPQDVRKQSTSTNGCQRETAGQSLGRGHSQLCVVRSLANEGTITLESLPAVEWCAPRR